MVNIIFISAGILSIIVGFLFFSELSILEINVSLAFLLVGFVAIVLGLAFDEPVEKIQGQFR